MQVLSKLTELADANAKSVKPRHNIGDKDKEKYAREETAPDVPVSIWMERVAAI